MPFQWREYTKKFKWELDPVAQLPTATIETFGAGKYVMCCPLCGHSHNLLANQPTIGLYEPRCLVNEFAAQGGRESSQWKVLRAEWARRFPEAARFKTIVLKAIEATDTGESHLQTGGEQAIAA